MKTINELLAPIESRLKAATTCSCEEPFVGVDDRCAVCTKPYQPTCKTTHYEGCPCHETKRNTDLATLIAIVRRYEAALQEQCTGYVECDACKARADVAAIIGYR